MPPSSPHSPKAEAARWISGPLSAIDHADFPIVAIGASAGGLVACRKLLEALPTPTGMAFIVVQHLDPDNDSLLADLLSTHTKMQVAQALDGMMIEREWVYVIPPGFYLSADDKGALRLSKPAERHGARLPFDYLLASLADAFGPRAIAVIMSGTGADGSVGLKAIKAKGGLVIAQDLVEADYDGMPRAAIATGAGGSRAGGHGHRRDTNRAPARRAHEADAARIAVFPRCCRLAARDHRFAAHEDRA